MTWPINANVLPEQCLFPSLEDHSFWAQQYVGADLLRSELKKLTYNQSDLTEILTLWDSSENGHGEFVSQIIAGPFPSAVIPLEAPLEFYKFKSGNNFGNYIRSQVFYRECLQNQNCPVYINHSLEWSNNENISRQVLKMNVESEITVITSASNDFIFVEEAKAKLARQGKLIIVASLDPRGRPSDFTNFSDAITIAAPSDSALRSYSFSGVAKDFSGTSGATPLVTGSLVGFTLISGHTLKTFEAIQLLQKTAIPLPDLPSSAMMGAGMLNAYKIGAVARRLKQKCQGRKKCVSASLFLPQTYQFKQQRKLPQMLEDTADTCAKRESLAKLRMAAFLNPTDPTLWERLAEATQNGEFYSSLAKRAAQRNADVLAEICQYNTEEDLRLLRYLPAQKLLALAKQDCSLAVRLNALELYLDYAENYDSLKNSVISIRF